MRVSLLSQVCPDTSTTTPGRWKTPSSRLKLTSSRKPRHNTRQSLLVSPLGPQRQITSRPRKVYIPIHLLPVHNLSHSLTGYNNPHIPLRPGNDLQNLRIPLIPCSFRGVVLLLRLPVPLRIPGGQDRRAAESMGRYPVRHRCPNNPYPTVHPR